MNLALLAAIALLAPLARPAAGCETTRVAMAPLTLIDGRFLADVEVNAQSATFEIDTGASRSFVTPDAVARLGLVRDPWVSSTVIGIGGIDRRRVADPASLTLAGVALRHPYASGNAMLVISPIPSAQAGDRHVDGLLGRDLLSAFDVLLDGPAFSMSLWRVRECTAQFRPPGGGYDAIRAIPAYGSALVIAVLADGTRLRALPDTGTVETTIAAPGMVRLGLTEAGPARQASGIGARTRPVSPTRLATLRVGDEVLRDQPVLGSRLHLFPIVDMLLGADWFAPRRVWLSYATGQVFVAPGITSSR